MSNHTSPQPWNAKRVLVTGACGTVGREVLRQLLPLGAREIVGVDNNESDLFFLAERHGGRADVRLCFGDVRDRDTLLRLTNGIDIVIHAAGLKHVLLCEESPREAIHTNIVGTQNVIDAALANGVERVIFTSSDKAVNPSSVMGTSKLMGERLMTAANALRRGAKPLFGSTRFGNVLGSRGSVVPLFANQIAAGGPVTLTDPRMTRFIMTLERAVALVMESVFLLRGGEVFVTKMPVVRIVDLARVLIDELAPRYSRDPASIPIVTVGVKAGEKLYEELMNDEETRRIIDTERYFVVTPAFRSVFEAIDYTYPSTTANRALKPYNSANEPAMSLDQLRAFIRQHQLLEGDDFRPELSKSHAIRTNR